jgi:hypothetical protein
MDHITVNRTARWKPEYIKRVGKFYTSSFEVDGSNEYKDGLYDIDRTVRTPSDHLGLYGALQFTGEKFDLSEQEIEEYKKNNPS